MTTLVERLAGYASALRYEDLPAEVVRQAKRLRSIIKTPNVISKTGQITRQTLKCR